MLAVLLLFVVAVLEINAKHFPSRFPRCNIDNPKINECLINATKIVRPYLIEGVPELGFPSVDPFSIPSITLEQGTQAVNFKATLNNITVYGLGNYEFTQYIFDIPNLEFKCKILIDRLHLVGLYTVVGKILLAPIQGQGTFTVNTTDVNIDLYQKVKVIKKRGDDYLQPVDTKTTVDIGDAKAHLSGLFDGNELLAKATNDIINDNIKELFEEVKPVLEDVITKIVEDLLFKSVENAIPYAELYPKTNAGV